jgi:sodium pump decarboxylase gamma subunit
VNDNLLMEGLQLMVAGMIVVFFFLALMVYAMNISAVILKKMARYFPEEQTLSPAAGSDKSIIAAVIAVAKSQANK